MNPFQPVRRLAQWPFRAGNLRPFFLLLGMLWSSLCFGQTTLWREGFEDADFWDRWHVEGGVWAVGLPTSGPNRSFSGSRAAATVLDGDYPPGADARLVRDRVFIVPPASENPRLRFWHWFRGAPGDARAVEVKVGAGPWQPLVPSSGWESQEWSRALFDLSPYSGQALQIAFHFQANADGDVAAGWYVDEVSVETGPIGSNLSESAEGFESGLGNWTIDHGVWEVGSPGAGPRSAFGGTNVVGTALDRNYSPGLDSRLISPEFVVPVASENPRLRFWHWFSVWPGDIAQVEISIGGGGWQPISRSFAYNSTVWSRPAFDLGPYAGQNVQVAFHFQSDGDTNVATGWYIDDVIIETGPQNWERPELGENFESGLGHWEVDNGTWEVGRPTFGAVSAYSGEACAGTVLTGPYAANVDSRLISPEFVIPAGADRPRLRFWHWLRNQPGDPATVELRPVGGQWQPLGNALVANDGSWARPSLALDAYAGQRVQVAFRLQSNGDAAAGAGWFVDDVVVETGPSQSNIVSSAEGFEQGLSDWAIDNGTWEIGSPVVWPETAYAGTKIAGTVLEGNYLPRVDSRLISPEFTLPTASANPRLRFWHWYSIWPGDAGTVEISVAGGAWQPLLGPYSGSGVVWTRPGVDLRAFAGQAVRVAFRFQSDEDSNVGRGWFIDEVVVETGAVELNTYNSTEDFESGVGDWVVENGTWEVGSPAFGPVGAYRGENSAATVLRFVGGRYAPNTDSRLVSPEFTVPCAEAGPRLRFAHWYDIAPGDEGYVEVREVGGAWTPVLGPISGVSREWITGFYDLSPFASKRVQVAFRFKSNADEVLSTGWAVDEIKVQATVLEVADSTTVLEGTLFTSTFGSPCGNLLFSLGPGAPPGALIDPSLGILVWLPGEDQGPGVYPMQVCVSDANQPFGGSTECIDFEVTVLENNTPPEPQPIEPQLIAAGVPLQVQLSALDVDRPAQTLTYALEQGAPFGATVDPVTGVFSWTPSPTQATTASIIAVRVTDSGSPPKSALITFTATPAGPISEVLVGIRRVSADLVTVCMYGGIDGTSYVLETTTDLEGTGSGPVWESLHRFVKIDQNFCGTTHSSTGVRYYRVRQAD